MLFITYTYPVYELLEYQTEDGLSPFGKWLEELRDRKTVAKVRTKLNRFRLGNLGDHKGVGEGVMEARIDYGPGYRIYFHIKGKQVILLLCGGDKDSQGRDISTAKAYLIDYRSRP